MGGMLAAIEKGFVQREIQQAAYEYQSGVESGSRVIVGINRYQEDSRHEIPTLRIDPEIERRQVERLKKLRAHRDPKGVAAALCEVETAARSDGNLLPGIVEAVKAYATVGEISGVLADVFGQYREAVVI
jgi:methylmalonyl-CoA mutase N-terminal domain/subunit